ncbi:MAG: MaoC family dehydratase [Proteobacteria bacterium]|nr:MaoC family dehydratase [Pseudomonadota bacterium]
MADNKLRVGDQKSLVKTFTAEEIENFAQICLDKNPIHLSTEAAQASGFKGKIVHGVLVASLISGILGDQMPGPGTIYLGNQVSFKSPLLVGDEVTATVKVIKIREDKPIATLETICTNRDGDVILEGEAVVKFPGHLA